MQLVAIKLISDIANPIPVLMEEDVQSNPSGIESAESGHPAAPLENLPPSQDIPGNQTMVLNGIT